MAAHRWLPERLRAGVAAGLSAIVAVVVVLLDAELSAADGAVLALLVYLVAYLALTITAFMGASSAEIGQWAQREERGTFLQRYVFGTAPGPGASLFIATGAMAVAVLWLPTDGGAILPRPARVAVAVLLVVVAWASVVVSFAVAYRADNLIEDEKGLEFPGRPDPGWSDYVYFAVGVMATFGTTDVDVRSSALRRTITVHSVIAFAFNTITVATLVSAIATL